MIRWTQETEDSSMCVGSMNDMCKTVLSHHVMQNCPDQPEFIFGIKIT